MKITLTQVFVADQQKAMEFYTDVLGFKIKQDIPMGEFRWLTVVSPEQADGIFKSFRGILISHFS